MLFMASTEAKSAKNNQYNNQHKAELSAFFIERKRKMIPASMPIRVVYRGDGATVNFPVPFMYFANADGTKQLLAIKADSTGLNETTLVENTDFTITDAGKPNGTLTLLSALEEGKKLTIVYDIPIEQPIDWAEFARLPSESIETSFDRVIAILKQHKEILDRCVKVVVSGEQTPQELLDEVYDKLDSATEIAADARSAANEATTAANNATAAVASAESTLAGVKSYVDSAKTDIDNAVAAAESSIEETITEAVADVKQQAVAAAEETIADAATTVTNTAKTNLNNYIDETVKPDLQTYVDAAASSATAAAGSATAAKQSADSAKSTAETAEQNIAAAKTTAINTFNSNATAKTDAFNTNAAAKQALIDASVTAAQNAASAAANSQTDAANSKTAAKQSELKAAAYAERVRSEGIPMSIIEQRRIEKDGSTVKLYWRDPRDTIIDGYTLASWKSTTIVKKQGSYPEDIDDGEVVAIVTARDQYADNPLTDTQADAANWYYRAFPLSVNGVYSLDKRNCFGVVIFGYRINEVDPVPSTRVEYLPYCDNYFYDPCVMDFGADQFSWGSWRKAFFIPRPCALKYDGTVAYYLNPDNFTLKEDGSASDVANSAFGGNFMCEFPSIFVKCWKENNFIYVLFSNAKVDDGFECWATKKSDGTYAKNFYLPMFEGINVDGKLRSIGSHTVALANTNAETEATYATANGTGWNTTLWADEMLMMLLFPLLFKSTESQGALGFGAPTSTNGLTSYCDGALTRGLMYGTQTGNAAGVTFLGLHNWWGHRWRRPNGLMNANGNIKVKMTHSQIDGSTVTGFNRSGEGYITTGFVPPAANASYISRYMPMGKYGMFPWAVAGSSSTYYCDGMWTNNGQLDQLIIGGSVANGALCGAFCINVATLPAVTNWNFGASPSYHHL